jgi:hypothetical protein
MYEVRDFDPAVVALLIARAPEAIDEHGMMCPLRGHGGHWLRWRDGKRLQGTELHAEPAVRFHASPTYVLSERDENLIVGRDVLGAALAGGKAETQRLGHENSEDALSWNVFRALQEAGALRLATTALQGVNPTEEPELYLWGQRLQATDVQPWPGLARARAELEPGLKQQTEPDICLYLPGWGWLFVEAKFGSPTGVARSEPYLEVWRTRYRKSCADLFIWSALNEAAATDVPEQLLRNAAFARYLAREGEHAVVVALVREAETSAIEERFRRFCATNTVEFRQGTWESIYRLLPADEPELKTLRAYLKNKTLNLRPAFRLDEQARPLRLSAV